MDLKTKLAYDEILWGVTSYLVRAIQAFLHSRIRREKPSWYHFVLNKLTDLDRESVLLRWSKMCQEEMPVPATQQNEVSELNYRDLEKK